MAHAYFALRRQGCTVIARGEREHTRVRRSATFGKLVRDKIPTRIAERREAEITRKLPESIQKNFLISKLLEEALEVRNAEDRQEKTLELADLLEIIRALARLDGISMNEVTDSADQKRAKAGGFDEGVILLQTAILGRTREVISDDEKALTQVLAQRTSDDTYELPFTFFGFMEIDQPRSLQFETLGMVLHVILRSDRIEIRLSKRTEQLELPLDIHAPENN